MEPTHIHKATSSLGLDHGGRASVSSPRPKLPQAGLACPTLAWRGLHARLATCTAILHLLLCLATYKYVTGSGDLHSTLYTATLQPVSVSASSAVPGFQQPCFSYQTASNMFT